MDQLKSQQPVARFRPWQLYLCAALSLLGLVLIVSIFGFVATHKNYMQTANSMAPTILGQHIVGTCPDCGKDAYASPWVLENPDPEGPVMICSAFHVHHVKGFSSKVESADRFMVARHVMPQRWDLAVFRLPEDPQIVHVFRVVGLPGETVVLQNGEVWINGHPMTVPAALQGLKYGTDERFPEDVWATPEMPAKLGIDEYFVLGDFSVSARDSRFWKVGAEDHHPYAVPASHMEGVATRIYWPPSRAGSIRMER